MDVISKSRNLEIEIHPNLIVVYESHKLLNDAGVSERMVFINEIEQNLTSCSTTAS